MIDVDDRFLTERLAPLANPLDDSDWVDVRRRAGRGTRSRRWLALPLAAALAALVAGSAFGLYREVVDFFSAEPAPEPIVIEFGHRSALATIGLGPRVVPGEARKITAVQIGGRWRPLYVAPTRDGGFCWRWHVTGSCGRIAPNQRRLGGGWLASSEGVPAEISGHVLDPAIRRLELEYEDGERTEIAFVWVSKPIDAGFYIFEVPHDHLGAGHRARVLLGLDSSGDEVARVTYRYSDPRWDSGPDGLPRIADRTRKRTLFDFRDHRGERWTLVVAPAPGERLCYAYDGGGGCLSPRFPATIEGMGVQGGGAVNVCCAVAEGVAAVELRYEDGARTEVKPVDGFVLYVIPPGHYERGHRLERIVWRDASGNAVASRTIETGRKGIYPCRPEEEIELGYGATVCP